MGQEILPNEQRLCEADAQDTHLCLTMGPGARACCYCSPTSLLPLHLGHPQVRNEVGMHSSRRGIETRKIVHSFK